MAKDLLPDSTISHYRIVSKIGAGGMGEVYLAQDTSELNRTVAIKLLPAEVAADPKRMQRFVQEARSVSGLNHPNVLTIYEFGQDGATRFIVTEYVEGVTLREYLRTQPTNLQEVMDIAMQIAAALDAAHETHVVHRDIKPENIMVRRRDHIVKVLDFGLAKPVEKELEPDVDPEANTQLMVNTEPGVVMGTTSYMSPEQSAGLVTVDYRTDIWSLGAVLYEMIAGRVPFEGKDVHRQVIAIQEQAAPPLSGFVPLVPERLEEIVTKALAKDPDERYQTAKDLLIDLRNLKRKLEVDAEIARTAPVDLRAANTISNQRLSASMSGAKSIAQATESHSVSSAEYIVKQIKQHRRTAVVLCGVLAIAGAAILFWYFQHTRAALLTDKDTILLTEFDNQTGEEVFDRTLRQGLEVQLQQSPFLDLFPEQRVRATLQLMSLSPDERVTRDRAREICQRQGL